MKKLTDQEITESIIEPLSLPEERWRDVRNFESKYAVSDLGRVFSFKRKRMLKPSINKTGRRYVYFPTRVSKYDYEINTERLILKMKSYEVGYLVALAFLRDSHLNEKRVKHIDNDPSNNRPENLKWA